MFDKTFTAIVMIGVVSAFATAEAVEDDLRAKLEEAEEQSHDHYVGMLFDDLLDESSRR